VSNDDVERRRGHGVRNDDSDGAAYNEAVTTAALLRCDRVLEGNAVDDHRDDERVGRR
jgi:hypothetical protein